MAVCRCQDCGPEQHFCLDCATSLHNNRNNFHVLELWKVIHYIIVICIFYVALRHMITISKALLRRSS